jgi:hypothetical protein
VCQDIHPGQTASGIVVIVISLLMATMQTGASAGGRPGVGPARGDQALELSEPDRPT